MLTVTAAGTLLLVLLVVEDRISLTEAGAAALAVRLLSGRLEATFAGLARLFERALFLQDLREFLALQRDAPAASSSALGPVRFSVLSARGVRFRYPSGEGDVLHGVDLGAASR